MNEQEIIDGNNLIAEYLGVDIQYSDTVYKDSRSELRHIIDNRDKSEGLLFHCSWDWLMPVVGKIETEDIVVVKISLFGCVIENQKMMNTQNIISTDIYGNTTKLLSVWQAVVNYLKNK
jgi:hypothetical protein